MDLHRWAAIARHQRRFPPLQAMVQAYLGIEPEPEPATVTPDNEEAAIADFMRNFAAAGGIVH